MKYSRQENRKRGKNSEQVFSYYIQW